MGLPRLVYYGLYLYLDTVFLQLFHASYNQQLLKRTVLKSYEKQKIEV